MNNYVYNDLKMTNGHLYKLIALKSMYYYVFMVSYLRNEVIA